MFSRRHLEEIRRRRCNRYNRGWLDNTISVDRPLRMMNSSTKHLLNCSGSVAKHIRQMGNCHCERRISLPLKPIGSKLSKVIHRKSANPSPTKMLPESQITTNQMTRFNSQGFKTGCDLYGPKLASGGTKTDANLEFENCHSLCLPDWLINRLRPVWSSFEKPPPPLTRKAMDQTNVPTYTLKNAMECLRELKNKANVDLDEMFSSLGLNTSEVALRSPIIWKKQETTASRRKGSFNKKANELINVEESSSASELSKECGNSNSPLKKRPCINWDNKDCQRPTTIDRELSCGQSTERTVEQTKTKDIITHRTHSSSSDTSLRNNDIHSFVPARGLDMCALELHDSFIKGDNSPFSCSPQFYRPAEREQAQRKWKSPGLLLDKRSKNKVAWLNGSIHPFCHEPVFTYDLSKAPRLPDRLNRSLQEEPFFQRHANSHSTSADQENLWISPRDYSSKSVRFEAYPTRILIPRTPSVISTEQQKTLAPMHPMWDTPDELKTSHLCF